MQMGLMEEEKAGSGSVKVHAEAPAREDGGCKRGFHPELCCDGKEEEEE